MNNAEIDENEEVKRYLADTFDIDEKSIKILDKSIEISNLKNNLKSNDLLADLQCRTDKGEFVFKNCIFNFNKELCLTLKNSIKFYNCEFRGEFNINGKNSELLNLDKCKFYDDIRLSGKINIINIRYTSFKSIGLENITNERLFIYNATINEDFDMYGSAIKSSFGFMRIENCEFEKEFYIESIKFLDDVVFQKCKFKNLRLLNTNFNVADFSDSTFIDADFSKSAFKSVANFKGCEFGTEIDAEKTIDLSEIIFEDNAYFDECEFNYFVAFHSTSFKKTASFYKAKFNVMPNFSPGDFQGILNLNNTEWFDGKKAQEVNFDIIKSNVEKAYSNHDFAENIINFRSSFCGIKNALSAMQNQLDAKNFHKAELYCKEMELDYEIQNDEKKRRQYNKKINLPNTNNTNFLYPQEVIIAILGISLGSFLSFIAYMDFTIIESSVFSLVVCILLYAIYIIVAGFIYTVFHIKDFCHLSYLVKIPDITKWIESLMLYLYRNTSDHHTNLNKILHFTFLIIASYGLFLLCVNKTNFFIIAYKINLDEVVYFSLNFILLGLFIFIPMLNIKKISDMSAIVIVFLFAIFAIVAYILPMIGHVTFGILLYILILSILYSTFVRKSNWAIILTKLFTYICLILVLLLNPGLINPALNIFNKENIENKNLLEKLSRIDYSDLSNLTRLSLGNYNIDANVTFLESTIINQKELIIANKATLESVLGFLFKRNEKEEIDRILQKLDNKNDLNITLKEPKNRSIALDLIYAANKFAKRHLYDMEFSDKFRLKFGLADEKEIQKEIDLVIDALMKIENILQKLAPVVEKQKIYLDIYNAIRLDKINSQTYKSTYILYVIIMILCLYSLTKTARKNSVIS